MIATASLVILILTGIPSEISLENHMTIVAIVFYVAAAIVLIVEWIRHFLRYRNKDKK